MEGFCSILVDGNGVVLSLKALLKKVIIRFFKI